MLYLIPTPVGNMEDMTFRAIRLLKEADLILCEDTRTSGILLKHFGIEGKRLMAHHKFNEHGTSSGVVEHLKAGETVCLITDAGTPGISDPGFFLVREAVAAGIEVQTLPGATAFTPALVSSGLPCDRFCFEGFLPQKKGRQTRLQELARESRTMIIYESPRRLVKSLEQFAEVFGEERQVSVCREISKVHEESVRGTLAEVAAHFRETEPKGEIVIILQGATSTPTDKEEKEQEASAPTADKPLSKYQRKMMKNLILIITAVMFFAACTENKPVPAIESDQHRVDSLQNILNQKDDEINEMMATLNEIQEGFRIINAAEGKVAIIKDGESTNKTEQIRQSIRNISAAMDHNRDLIAKLQKQVRESSVRGEQLKATIESLMAQLADKDTQLRQLQAQLEEKDIHIAELDKTVSNLNTNVNQLKEESSTKTETINAQDKQINTAYYVFGTKRELEAQSIYQKGKVLQSSFNKNYFTKIDIRVDKEIKLYSKSAQILTAHPSSSYTLTQDTNKQYILRITNPQQFWSTSKYLVVLVK